MFQNNVLFSEDFQMEVSHPAWRAPIRKGDRIRITGIYGNKNNAWYDVMTHQGIYIDPQQPPRDGCKPYLVGGLQEQKVTYKKVKRKKVVRVKVRSKKSSRKGSKRARKTQYKRVVKTYWVKKKIVTGIDVTDGVMNRPWHDHHGGVCGVEGWPACDRPEAKHPPGKLTNEVTIANFLYTPGDMSLSGEDGAPPRVKQGTSLRFTNLDQFLLIRHSVTTCKWPCNGRYTANYPHPDGIWDSKTLGWDPIDGGEMNPAASTPSNLSAGKYAYFCRIHPWMRGAFEVIP
jgi:plastocyanin